MAHTHEHRSQPSPEAQKNKRKGKHLYLGSAAVAAATGAFELSKGLPNGMLGLVANGFHEYGDAAIRVLQGMALSARSSNNRRLNKAAAGVILVGSAVTLGQTGAELAVGGVDDVFSIDPKPVAPHLVGMAGNVIAGGLALEGAKHADPQKAEHTKRHVKLDLKKSAWLLAASVTGVKALDAAASVKLGVLESAELGQDMWRHADRSIDEIEEGHSHGHEHEHDHAGHAHNATLGRFRERARDVGAFVAARFTSFPRTAVERAGGMFSTEPASGERRLRWKPIAALGSLTAAAAGAYMAHRFGVSSSGSRAQVGDGNFVGSLFEGLPDLPIPRQPQQYTAPEVADLVEINLPGWNSKTGRGSIWGELEYLYPNASNAEINELKNEALSLNHLTERSARLLQPNDPLVLPVV